MLEIILVILLCTLNVDGTGCIIVLLFFRY